MSDPMRKVAIVDGSVAVIKVDDEPKMLGAQVESSLYWEFKKIAATRSESMAVAIAHAARLYIDIDSQEATANV